MFVVGETIRVLSKVGAEQFSRRAYISCVNDNGSYDIIYILKKNGSRHDQIGDDEEFEVNSSRVRQLEPFETISTLLPVKVSEDTFMAMKEEGNLLYKLKDFEAAEERYQLLLRSMSPTSKCIVASDFSVGQLVLIEFADTNSSSSIDVNFGIVSEVYKSDVDVIYDDVDTHSSLEAYHVPVKRLTMVSQDIGGRQIQRSVYMNLARCSMKRSRNGWAIKYCSIAIAVSQSIKDTLQNSRHPNPTLTTSSSNNQGDHQEEDIDKQLCESFYFRAKILLLCNRPKFATKDCRRVSEFDPAKATTLQREISEHVQRQQKLNRKLAKDVAAWVSTAMAASRSSSAASHLEGTIEDGDDGGIPIQSEDALQTFSDADSGYGLVKRQGRGVRSGLLPATDHLKKPSSPATTTTTTTTTTDP